MSPFTFLVIEDDDVDFMSVQRAFKRIGIANPIKRAVDGVEALELLRDPANKGIFGDKLIILLDLNMPRMSGHEFLDAYSISKNVPVANIFVMTTSDSDQDIIDAHRHDIAGYLLKSDLIESLREALDGLRHKWVLVA
ncbi:response regulator [Robiginitomaculum antarcticum]|uniref:response regulator n=1 Tax=Robiginitomaculum antarcticum TaxID=437507 RepID=UPI00036688B8|nr:response regulator [Robiginitomaculum antarcticum]